METTKPSSEDITRGGYRWKRRELPSPIRMRGKLVYIIIVIIDNMKTIHLEIREDIVQKLMTLKRPRESYSNVIQRLLEGFYRV